jgi:hypothetical protein
MNISIAMTCVAIISFAITLDAGLWAGEKKTDEKSQELLVGEWDGTIDTDNRILVTFNSDGTFVMLNVDPENTQRIKVRATGSFKIDFAVSPAHLDLHAIIRKPKHEDPVRQKIELIMQMESLHSFRMSNLESPERPKAFGEKAVIFGRRIPHLSTPADAIRFYKTAVVARDWKMAQECLSTELREMLKDSIANREFFDQYVVTGFATKTLELIPARFATEKDIADVWFPGKLGNPPVAPSRIGTLPNRFTAQVGHGGGAGGTPWMAMCTFVREAHGWKVSTDRVKSKEDFSRWHKMAIAKGDQGIALDQETKNKRDGSPVTLTLEAESTIELSPVTMKLTVTNKSKKAIDVSALMRSSVLILNGQQYKLHAVFHDQWKKMEPILPGQSVVVPSSTTYYGIGNSFINERYRQHKIQWHEVLKMGTHAVGIRIDGEMSNVTQANVFADH